MQVDHKRFTSSLVNSTTSMLSNYHVFVTLRNIFLINFLRSTGGKNSMKRSFRMSDRRRWNSMTSTQKPSLTICSRPSSLINFESRSTTWHPSPGGWGPGEWNADNGHEFAKSGVLPDHLLRRPTRQTLLTEDGEDIFELLLERGLIPRTAPNSEPDPASSTKSGQAS